MIPGFIVLSIVTLNLRKEEITIFIRKKEKIKGGSIIYKKEKYNELPRSIK